MSRPPAIVLPDGYDPDDPVERAHRTRYNRDGARDEDASRAKRQYMAWYRQRAREQRIDQPRPAPAETPQPARERRSSPAPAETRPAPRPTPPPQQHRLVQTPAVGANRRLQALAWLGWDTETLAAELRLDPPAIVRLLWAPPAEIPIKLADVISAGYRRLMIQPRDRDQPGAALARDIARIAHWAGPFRWDDIDHDKRPITSSNLTPDEQPDVPTDDDQTRPLPPGFEQLRDEADRLSAELAQGSDATQAALAQADDARRALNVEVERAKLLDDQIEALQGQLAAATARGDALHTEAAACAEQRDDARAALAEVKASRLDLTSEIAALRTTVTDQTITSQAARDRIEQLEDMLRTAQRQQRTSRDLGQVTVEQTADGSRITFASSKPAQIRFAGLSVDVLDITGGGVRTSD